MTENIDKILSAQSHINGALVAKMILDFWREMKGVYPDDVMVSALCAVGPLQTMIGLAIESGLLAQPDTGKE